MFWVFYVFVFLIGLAIGSFLNVLIYRLPREEEIVITPSHCPTCNSKLKPYDLIPVFSYLFLGGKCRKCKSKISIQYPLIELLTGILFAFITYISFKNANYNLTTEVWLNIVELIILAGISIPIFFIDLKHYIIPNGLVLTGLIAGLGLKIADSIILNNWYILADGLYGLLLGAGIFIIIMLLGKLAMKTEVMGMGDVKLISVLGIFAGFQLTIVMIFASYILGSIISIILLATKKKTRKDIIPFGPFIILGMIVAITYGQEILDWYLSAFEIPKDYIIPLALISKMNLM